MEVASRACGTSTMTLVRTGASWRRWHHGSVRDMGVSLVIAAEDAKLMSLAGASRASSMENRHPNFADVSTICSGCLGRSGESGMDKMCT